MDYFAHARLLNLIIPTFNVAHGQSSRWPGVGGGGGGVGCVCVGGGVSFLPSPGVWQGGGSASHLHILVPEAEL